MKIISNTFKAIIFFGLAFTLANCSNDDADAPSVPIVYTEQNPLEGYLAVSGFNQSGSYFIDGGNVEIGFSFFPTVTGRINAITAKIPGNRNGMRVTIWDKLTGTIIRTEHIDVTAGTMATKSIYPLPLVKNKEYIISCNTDDWYDHRRSNNSSVTYPLAIDDISITGSYYLTTAAQTIPTIYSNSYYTGDISFVFQRTE
ncbi:MAG: DUF4082 domain-containing protein [Bacteroidota bacterium]